MNVATRHPARTDGAATARDGTRIAYVGVNELQRRVVVRSVADGRESVVNADRNADRLAWSPTGDRIDRKSTRLNSSHRT